MTLRFFLYLLIFTYVNLTNSARRLAKREDVRLQIEPVNIVLYNGQMIQVNCSLVGNASRQFNSSQLAFKFILQRPMSESSERNAMASSQHEICDEEPEIPMSPDDYDTYMNFSNSSTLDDGSNGVDPGNPEIQVDERYVRIVNRRTAELNFPNASSAFHEGILNCYVVSHPAIKKKAHMTVGDKPYVPEIVSYALRDWTSFEFSWRTERKQNNYKAEYVGWFRNSSSEDFTKCLLSSRTTPSPLLSGSARHQYGCPQMCVVPVNLGFKHEPQTSVFTIKVTCTNLVGNTSSLPVTIDLYDIVTPNPVLDLKFETLNSTACFTFYSPKPGAHLQYEALFVCLGKQYNEVLVSMATVVEACVVKHLPVYSSCTGSVRSKPYGYGRWSSWSDTVSFTTPQLPPLAAPEICPNCFEVVSLKDTGQLTVNVFLKPLPRELARGEVVEYRGVVRDRNVTEIMKFPGNVSTLELLHSAVSSSCDVFVSAATEPGYNESIVATPLKIDLSATDELKYFLSNVTSVVVNNHVVRLSWSCHLQTNLSAFTVFWCRGGISCKHPIQWRQVSSTVRHDDVIPSSDVMDHVYGVAVETTDGRGTSGIIWSRCLYYLSRVGSPPRLSFAANGTSKKLSFQREDDCNGGYPYAYRINYCAVENEEDKTCTGPESTLLVNSSEEEYVFHHLPPDIPYRFMVSSLTVAGPSISQSVIVPAAANSDKPSNTTSIPIAVGVVVILVVLIAGFVYFCRSSRYCRKIHITTPSLPSQQRVATSRFNSSNGNSGYAGIGFGFSPPNNDMHSLVAMENGNSSSNFYTNDSGSARRLLVPSLNWNLDSGLSDQPEILDTRTSAEVHADSETRPEERPPDTGDSDCSNSFYRSAKLSDLNDAVPLSEPVDPAFNLESGFREDSDHEESSAVGSQSAGYALGRMGQRQTEASGSRGGDSLDGVSLTQGGGSSGSRVQSSSGYAVGVLPASSAADDAESSISSEAPKDCFTPLLVVADDDDDDEGGGYNSGDYAKSFLSTTKPLRQSQDNVDGGGDEDDEDDDSIASSCDYAMSCLQQKDLEPLLSTPAAKLTYNPDDDLVGDSAVSDSVGDAAIDDDSVGDSAIDAYTFSALPVLRQETVSSFSPSTADPTLSPNRALSLAS